MSELEKVLAANAEYVEAYPYPEHLPHRPTRKIAVLTCMDCRLEPDNALGLAVPEANYIRNAGGRASDDALRSLVVSTRLLGAEEIFVVQHLDCGMSGTTQAGIVEVLARENLTLEAPASMVDWLTIGDPEATVRADVEIIRNYPLLSADVAVHGFLLDPKTGALLPVTDAD